MMKNYLFLLLITVFMATACSQSDGPYDESANARTDIQQALVQAANQQKPAIIIFGANWCPDCRALSETMQTGPEASKIATDFIVVKVNVGNFDTNLDVAADYGNPIQGGIPGAALLTADGSLVYTTKPGELSTVRQQQAEGLYAFFKKHLS